MADLLVMVRDSLECALLVDYDVMSAPTRWLKGGWQHRKPHFVDDVPAEDDNDELIG